MKKTLIFYDCRYETTAWEIMDNYTKHGHYADMICMLLRDDIEYAKKNGFDEAIFIERPYTVTVSDIRHGCVSDLTLRDILYGD